MLSYYNLSGLNSVGKQEALHNVIYHQTPHIICLNETKLQGPLFMVGYWANQTELQRSGGCWTAACKGISLTLTKSLGTYMCWSKAIVRNSCINVLNCYLEQGEDEQIKNRAARIAEIAADILKQDSQARIVVCGDFNK